MARTPSSKKPKGAGAVTPALQPQSAEWTSELFTVGHLPQTSLSAEQQKLFQSFQSNLISLLSHELRTPLMGILNALSAVDEGGEPLGGLSLAEALSMARTHAQGLESALLTVLDLAAWEAGALKVELREAKLSEVAAPVLGLEAPAHPTNTLLDAGRLSRALQRLKALLVSLSAPDAVQASWLAAEGSGEARGVRLRATLSDDAGAQLWDQLWHEAQVARAANASLPLHVFAGVLQSEQAFLSRTREGLGAELHLAAQVLAQHEARLQAVRRGRVLELELEFPEIAGRARIIQAVRGRIWRPGLAEPGALHLTLHAKKPEGLAPGQSCYALEPGRGPWIELSAEPSRIASPLGRVACPEHGVDAAALMEQLLSSR